MTGQVGGPDGAMARVRDLIFRRFMVALPSLAVGGLLLAGFAARGVGETCTTQSAMTAADRGAIAEAARSLGGMVKANDAAGLDGTLAEAQFFCSLNRSTMEAEFTIPALPAGKYAFAIVMSSGGTGSVGPWRLSMLMRQDAVSSRWLLAGFYPSATTAAGHDGLWYWKQARVMVTAKQPWNAWLYYQAAAKLLQPAGFVDSTHLEKLRTEAASAAPSTLSEGVSADAPLVVKGADGVEYHFTGLGVDDSLGQSMLDVAAHLRVEDVGDAATARKRNNDAAAALLGAYPELRKAFHGVWIYSEAAGKNPFATEVAMGDIK
jgi:hypothetical protein